MTVVAEKRLAPPVARHIDAKHLNAERVTTIALEFLRRLGNKGKLHPKRVSVEGERFIVEVDMRKHSATLQIDVATGEIKEYTIENKAEESSALPIQPKLLVAIVAVFTIAIVAMKFLNIF